MLEDLFDVDEEAERQEYEMQKEQERLNSLPKYIFKFKPVDSRRNRKYLLKLFKDSSIYMPIYKKLNDPHEGTNTKLLGIKEDERKEVMENWHILSLSEDCFVPAMWAHYAGNYAGVCLVFKTRETFNNIKKVKYVDDQECWATDPKIFLENDLLKKNKCWSYEKEWRIVSNTDDANFKFNRSDLQHIFIGYKTPEKAKKKIKKAAPQNAKIWIMQPCKDKFCLKAVNEKSDTTIYTIEDLGCN